MTEVDMTPLKHLCAEHGHLTHFKRGTPLANEGELCRYIGFVKSGYFKYVTIDSQAEECVLGFGFEGDVVTDFIRTIVYGMPSISSIIAGSDAEALLVPVSFARQHILESFPDFLTEATRATLHEAYRRYVAMHKFTPAERYAGLRESHPDEIDLIPHRELASFLTVSRRQFQRIREKLK